MFPRVSHRSGALQTLVGGHTMARKNHKTRRDMCPAHPCSFRSWKPTPEPKKQLYDKNHQNRRRTKYNLPCCFYNFLGSFLWMSLLRTLLLGSIKALMFENSQAYGWRHGSAVCPAVGFSGPFPPVCPRPLTAMSLGNP